MKKKNLLVLLAASTLLLAACGQKKPDDGKKDDPTPVEPGDDTIHVSSVTIVPDKLSVEVGKTGQLEAMVLPTNATNPTVTWSSSDTSVATVANGVVSGVKAGTSTITATADGKSGTCVVTVTNPVIPPEPIEHQDPFVSTVTDPSLTRDFREEFDAMVEDFSSATPSGETTGVFNKPVLRVLVDSEDENEPQTPDAAIYKMATGTHAIQNFEGIGFRMRAVGNKSINLSNLVLGLRGDDLWKVYPLNLANAVDPDQDALPELTDQFQDIIISPKQSVDSSTHYELLEGGDAGTAVLDKILGFHLYALDEECSAVIEIENVFLYEAGEKTVLDDFNRAVTKDVNGSVAWWRDSTGFIVQKGVTLKDASYTTKAIELGDYENIVINVLGDTSGLKINNLAYANFKDSEGKSLTGAVNGKFMSYVINLSQTNLALLENKLVFESTTEVVISQIFLTNLVNEAPVTEYPLIDIANASYLCKFNTTKAAGSIKTNYEDAAADTETNEALNLNHLIAWAGKDLVSMDGHNLVLAQDANKGLVNLVIGSKAEVKDYLVIALRATGNPASLRIKAGTNDAINMSDWVAGPGLPTVPTTPDYPYMLDDGFGLLIIDLERSGFAGVGNEINIFYNGDAKVEIDSIFFADAYVESNELEEGEPLTLYGDTHTNADLSGYGGLGTFDIPSDATLLKFVFSSVAGCDLRSLRFTAPGEFWFKDSALLDENGDVIPETTAIAANGQLEVIVDVVASGMSGAAALHSGGFGEATGDITLVKIVPMHAPVLYDEGNPLTLYGDSHTNADLSGYAGLGTFDIPADATLLKFVFSSTAGCDLRSLRFTAPGEFWFKDNALIDEKGNAISKDTAIAVNGQLEVIVDVVASGMSGAAALHSGGFGEATGDITLVEIVPLTLKTNNPYKIGDPLTLYGDSHTNGDLTGYGGLGTFDVPANEKYLAFTFSSTTGCDLSSIRFTAPGEVWFKDNAVIGFDGQAIGSDVEIGAGEQITIVINVDASGMSGAAAVHSGGFGEATGDITLVSINHVEVVNPYAKLLATYAG